jgi:hypothetical protein
MDIICGTFCLQRDEKKTPPNPPLRTSYGAASRRSAGLYTPNDLCTIPSFDQSPIDDVAVKEILQHSSLHIKFFIFTFSLLHLYFYMPALKNVGVLCYIAIVCPSIHFVLATPSQPFEGFEEI